MSETDEFRTEYAVIHDADRKAVMDVLNERVYQIRDLDYTPAKDDTQSPGDILSHGKVRWLTREPSRDELVKVAACAIAAISRIDRMEE